jgi:deoxyribonuclease V
MWSWPRTGAELVDVQRALAAAAPIAWTPPDGEALVGGCFVCFPRGHTGPGGVGDPAWAAAVLMRGKRLVGHHVTVDAAGAPYEQGLLALRMGAVLERAVRGLPERPDVLLVDATGRDHPRRAGLALHLGAVLDLPTVGLTHRPLVAVGEIPPDHTGATSPLLIDAAWRVDAVSAVDVVRRCSFSRRTPEPLREARRLARMARDREFRQDVSP